MHSFFLIIWEDPYSSLGSETRYLAQGFLWFTSVRPGIFWDSTLKQVTAASFHILSNSLCINHLAMHCYVVSGTDGIAK
jgi:hypothetical protein